MLHLQQVGDVRNLIRLVDTWAEVTQPTADARLAQAAALLDLCQTDRAWIRLQELTDAGEGGTSALILTARMFIQRGWPKHARRPLELAMAEDPDAEGVQELWRRAHAAPLIPDPDVRVEDDTPVEDLIQHAEAFLSTGSVINGRRILEQLRKRVPAHQRIADLLWALQGDFRLPHATLSEAVTALEPGLGPLTDVTEDVEHTESLGPAAALMGMGSTAADLPDAAFPALFRDDREMHLPEPTAETTATELTHAAALASTEELGTARDGRTDPSGAIGSGDTEIMLVIHRDSTRKERPTGKIHLQDSVDAAKPGFDLDAYRREMGMTYPSMSANLEEEDDELIILTGPERERVAPPEPMEDLELMEPETTSHDTTTSSIPMPKKEDQGPEATTSKPVPRNRKPRSSTTPWWLLSFGVVLWLAAAFLVTMVLLKFISF